MTAFFNRRRFLGSSLGGLAALSLCPASRGQDRSEEKDPKRSSDSEEVSGFDSLFLTWRSDPTTTMTIQWVGPETVGEAAAVHCAPVAGGAGKTGTTIVKPYPDTDLKVHRCELSGLTAGTEYKFQIGQGSPEYRFRTLPAKATNAFQFVSGGDAGTGHAAVGTNILAAKQEPYFALIGGDLAYDNGKSPDTFLTFLQNYRKHMVDPQKRLIPMIACPGNHEVNGGYNGKRENAPHYLSVFDGFFPETSYGVLDIGDYLSVVLLDSGHLAPIGGAQTDWLATVLAERQDRPHLIVANHVPAYPSYRAPQSTGAEQRKYWSPLFEKYNVDVVLEHHDHTFKRTHPLKDGLIDSSGVVYLGDGSWGKLRIPKQPEERPYLAAVATAFHMTVHRLEGDQRFHVALEDNGKVADVCMTVSKRPARRG